MTSTPKRFAVSVAQPLGAGKPNSDSFTPKQIQRLASLLEVASQSTESSTDSALLDRLSRLFS